MDLLHSGSMGTGDLKGFHTLDGQGSRRIRGNNRKHKEIQTQGQLPVQSSRQPRDGCRYRPAGDPGAAAGTSRRAARGRLPVQADRLAWGGCRYRLQGRLPVQADGRPGDGCRYRPAGWPGAAAGTGPGAAAGISRRSARGRLSVQAVIRARNGCRYKPETGSRYQLAQAAPIHAGVPRTLLFFIPVPGGPGSPDSYRCPADTPPPMDHGGRQAAATGVQRTPPLRWAMGAGRVRLPVSSGHPPSDGPWVQAGRGCRRPADTPP